jgi:hypothetical protein
MHYSAAKKKFDKNIYITFHVIPAKAGIGLPVKRFKPHPIPAFTGMT